MGEPEGSPKRSRHRCFSNGVGASSEIPSLATKKRPTPVGRFYFSRLDRRASMPYSRTYVAG